jgi:hypothetical protein
MKGRRRHSHGVTILSGAVSVLLGIVSLALAVFATLCAVLVPVGSILAMRRYVLRDEHRGVSNCPLVGAVAGFLAVVVAPIGTIRSRVVWSWAPLAIEVSVFLLVAVLWNVSGLARRAARQRAARKAERVRATPR